MALWDAYIYDGKGQKQQRLGRVRADNSPRARLNAYKKFKVPAAQQRRVGVERVGSPPPAPPPFSPEAVAVGRALTAALNAALREKE